MGRTLAEWDLDLGDEMGRRWSEGEVSLRSLEREINVAVLRAAAREAGMAPIDGEAENFYRVLTDEGVTSGTRIQARHRLENAGVDVEALESAFVSHQTVYNHLTGCLGVERDDGDRDPTTALEDRVRPMQTRMEAVASDVVAGLRSNGEVVVGDFDVFVDVSVACNDCGTRRELGEFVDERGCDCDPD